MTDREKLKEMLGDLKLSYKDVAEITGHSYQSVKSMLRPNGEIPRWVRLALHAYFKSRS